jgi:hypothetical protein
MSSSVGTAGQHVAEVLLEIELADQQVDLAGNFAAVFGQNLQFGFHRVGGRCGCRRQAGQVFAETAGDDVCCGGDHCRLRLPVPADR